MEVCSAFPSGQEDILLGITFPAAHPVPGSELALPGSPEVILSEQSQREVNLSARCFA